MAKTRAVAAPDNSTVDEAGLPSALPLFSDFQTR
jgi:hypothetical protein